ncbi:hypothetical protein EJ04DRAFT_516346 [Polyplosphaeria fusca]|uniref:Uncharacterized protein n=1 Tax=Polyplosphaeria fusca TaxID=682080 RepID=A0A9P4UY57_9PLEO|nr:hypothetical protein EJ04DRAFT_516346 [Polyplosphaeria fusca]
MAQSDAPMWLETVSKKRQIRDEAIQSFIHHASASKVGVETACNNVDDVLLAISSGAVTATRLCETTILR